MFEKMPNQAQRLNETRNGQSEVDLSRFVDPLAKQIGWDFLDDGWVTYGIVAANSNRIEFRMICDMKLIFNIYLITVILLLVVVKPESYFRYIHLFFPITIVGSLIVWGCVLYLYRDSIVFDKRKGYFWKGSNQLFEGDIGIDYVKLERIHALQLITGIVRVETRRGPYYDKKNELNLVLDNGERMNVVHHENKNQIEKDARVLSKYLGVPIWEEKKTENKISTWYLSNGEL